MAKELPYFQFEPAEYLTKDISFCSLSAQGLFINICSYYWQRQCILSLDQFKRRLNHEKELKELIDEGVVDIKENMIKIKFLDIQFEKATKLSKEQSRKGSLGGRPKKEKPKESQTETELKPNKSQTKAIREDKIKEEEIKEDNNKTTSFSFYGELIKLGLEKKLVNDWLKVRKTKKMTNTETAFKNLKIEFEKSGKPIDEIITKCVTESWGGFKASWQWESNNNKNSENGTKQSTTGFTEKKPYEFDLERAIGSAGFGDS